MFNRYWRSYPWYFQLFQLIILMVVLLSFFGLMNVMLVPKITGFELNDALNITKDSPYMLRQAALLAQALSSFGLFIAVPLLFAYATHPRPAEYLGLRKPGKSIQIPLVILIMIGLIPLESQISVWVSLLPWSKSIVASETGFQKMMEAITVTHSAGDFIKLLLVVALLPAVGEELLFRGVLMRFAAKRFKGMWMPVLISAVMFALVHTSFFNFTSILIAGSVLGIIYYRTGSLVMSMLGHFTSNAIQVFGLYFAGGNEEVKTMLESNEVPLWLLLSGVGLFAISFAALWKYSTPLLSNWSDDFSAEEKTIVDGQL